VFVVFERVCVCRDDWWWGRLMCRKESRRGELTWPNLQHTGKLKRMVYSFLVFFWFFVVFIIFLEVFGIYNG